MRLSPASGGGGVGGGGEGRRGRVHGRGKGLKQGVRVAHDDGGASSFGGGEVWE